MLRDVCILGLLRDATATPSARYLTDVETAMRGRRTRTSRSLEIRVLKVLAIGGAVVAAAGSGRVASVGLLGSAAACSLLEANVRNALVPRTSSKSHLHTIAALLAVHGTLQHDVTRHPDSEDLALDRTTLRAAEFLVASVYTQAAVAKLQYGGASWATAGAPIRNALALSGTSLGRMLSRSPALVRHMSRGALAFEMVSVLAPIAPAKCKRWFGVAAVGFHFTNHYLIRVSYWHLAWLSGALFFVPDHETMQYARFKAQLGSRG